MTPYPLLFEPLLKPKVWGGRTLTDLGKALPPDVAIGESWELADLPLDIEGGRSVIRNGPLAGRTLGEAVRSDGQDILGAAKAADDGGFPLLVKYLDARQNLSVQVHPDEAYAARHHDAHLKSEAWFVVRAEPDAVIYKGVRPGVTRELFRRHIEDGTLVDDLIAVPARVGDCHYLPSGTCHALGAGILVAEVQTPSDTTFRVFDWGRTGRTLHIEAALECIDFGDTASPVQTAPPASPASSPGSSLTSRRLLHTGHFALEHFQASAREEFPVVTNGLPEVWMILSGSLGLQTSSGQAVDVVRGETVLLPAALDEATLRMQRATAVLRITLPSPLEGRIA